MLFNNPISPEKAERLIDLLALSPESRVLDAGCGEGEFLIRVIERYGCHGVGVDNNPLCIKAAREKVTQRLPEVDTSFVESGIDEAELKTGSFDAAICMGSTHAFGMGDAAYPNALDALKDLVRPGGLLLIGEGYWKQEPAPDYLELIGEPVGIYHDHTENISFAEARGLTPLYAAVSNQDEWDHFEWSHKMAIEKKAEENPDAPEMSKRLAHARRWRDGYLKWGRTTMGFGFYLFKT